jgi:hypothetical protein
MADILDYQLDIGETLYFIVGSCIKKGVCRLVDIKIYLDESEEDPEVVTDVKYLIEIETGETFLISEESVYAAFAEASAVLELLVDSEE